MNDETSSRNSPNQNGDGVCAYGVGGEDVHPRCFHFHRESLIRRWGVVGGGDDADASVRQNHRRWPQSAGHGLLSAREADAWVSHSPGIPCEAVYRSQIDTPCDQHVQHLTIKLMVTTQKSHLPLEIRFVGLSFVLVVATIIFPLIFPVLLPTIGLDRRTW